MEVRAATYAGVPTAAAASVPFLAVIHCRQKIVEYCSYAGGSLQISTRHSKQIISTENNSTKSVPQM